MAGPFSVYITKHALTHGIYTVKVYVDGLVAIQHARRFKVEYKWPDWHFGFADALRRKKEMYEASNCNS